MSFRPDQLNPNDEWVQALQALLLRSHRGVVVRFHDADQEQRRLFVHIESGRAWLAENAAAVTGELDATANESETFLRDQFHLICTSVAEEDSLDLLVHVRTADHLATLGIACQHENATPFVVAPPRQKLEQFAENAAVRLRVRREQKSQPQILFSLTSLDGRYALAKAPSKADPTRSKGCIGLERVSLGGVVIDAAGSQARTSEARSMALGFTVKMDTYWIERECYRTVWKRSQLVWLSKHAAHCLSADAAKTSWVDVAPAQVAWIRVAVMLRYWPQRVPIMLRNGAVGGKPLEGAWYGVGTNHSLSLWLDASPVVCLRDESSASKPHSRWQVGVGHETASAPAVFRIVWRERQQRGSCFFELCCASDGARPANDGIALYLGIDKRTKRLVLKHRPRQWEAFELDTVQREEPQAGSDADTTVTAGAAPASGARGLEEAYFAGARRTLQRERTQHASSPADAVQRREKARTLAQRRARIMDSVAQALAAREAARSVAAPADHTAAGARRRGVVADDRSAAAAPAMPSEETSIEAPHESGAQPQTVQGAMSSGPATSQVRCAACHGAIVGQYVRALSQSYHPGCFTCSICRRALAPETKFRTSIGNPLCEACYAEHVAPRCARCKAPITDVVVTALERKWHRGCLWCVRCGQPLCHEGSSGSNTFYLYPGQPDQPHCESCVRGKDREQSGRRTLPSLGGGMPSGTGSFRLG
jgi:mono/diheme cytochrome c family protein